MPAESAHKVLLDLLVILVIWVLLDLLVLLVIWVLLDLLVLLIFLWDIPEQ